MEKKDEENSVIVQVDKTVVKVTGIDVKGLNIQQLEKILLDKLKSMVRVIGVTGESIEMDVYGIDEDDILREKDGIIKAIATADGITLSDLAQISSVEKIKKVDFDKIPEYHEGTCMKERWLNVH
ncbi:MAG: hypothetical protein LKJ13_06565 [Clostridia bacterium]|jgi:hypothetical protein|nr:hypothetical protein [Clostridia bacterium]MCI1958473.1 hypothetical protein [Clostridia bacterium]MCI1999815.1 hypothetical protein [Clostridia bacterium]MCI2014269.1 hypothetical protein [Clostridia bacterium]